MTIQNWAKMLVWDLQVKLTVALRAKEAYKRISKHFQHAFSTVEN